MLDWICAHVDDHLPQPYADELRGIGLEIYIKSMTVCVCASQGMACQRKVVICVQVSKK